MGLSFLIGSVPKPVFTPPRIVGLKLWFDFSDLSTLFQNSTRTNPVTADGQSIGGVVDKSGNGFHGSQPSGTYQPVYKANIKNGLGICRTDTTDYLSIPLSSTNSSHTFVGVVSPPAAGTTSRTIFDSQSGRLAISTNANNPEKIGYFDGAWKTTVAPVVGFQIVSWVLTAGVGGEIFKNGASLGTATYTTKLIGGNTAMFTNVDSPGVANGWNGDIGEWFIFDGAISNNDRINLETYLNKKWAIY